LIESTVGASVFGSLAAADFFSTTNTKIFEALEEISREKKNFDLHEVLDRVHENGGELDFHQLEVMLDGVVVSNVDYHVQKVRDAARRREILTPVETRSRRRRNKFRNPRPRSHRTPRTHCSRWL
jgi:replicative DNA helicase